MINDHWPHNVPIVDGKGMATIEFLRWLQQSKENDSDSVSGKRKIITSAAGGLSGGGDLSADRTIVIQNQAGVIIGTYGSATRSCSITVNAKGIITSLTDTAISGGGGSSGGWWQAFKPVVADFPTAFKAAADATPNAVITNDTDLGLVIKAQFPGSDRWKGWSKAIPAGVNWQVSARISFNMVPQNYCGISLIAYNAASAKLRALGYLFDNGYKLYHTDWTLSAFVSHVGSFIGPQASIFVRYIYTLATDALDAWMSFDGKNWWFHGTRTVAASFGAGAANRPDFISPAIFTTYAQGAGFEIGGVCDYWVQSW